MGVVWCSENKNIILEWLRSEAANRKIIFFKAIALLLINLSIKNAKRNNLQ
jgi:hypothetical protein